MKREVLEGCNQGRAQAVATMIDDQRRRLGGLAFAALGRTEPSALADVAADAVAGVLKEVRRAPAGPAFDAWFADVAMRAAWSRHTVPERPTAPVVDGEAFVPVAADTSVADIRAAIASLPPESRRLLWLVTTRGMTLDEAAEILHRPTNLLAEELEQSLQCLRRESRLASTPGEAGSVAGDHPAMKLAYRDIPAARRTEAQRELDQDEDAVARQRAVRAERAALAAAFTIDVEPAAVMRELREKVRLGGLAVPAAAWVAAQIVIALGLVAGLIVLADYVPAPRVEPTLEVGEAVRFRHSGGEVARATATPDDAGRVAQTVPPVAPHAPGAGESIAPGVAMEPLAVGEAVRTGPYSRLRLRIAGNYDLQLGSDTTVAVGAPSASTPLRLYLERGVVHMNLRGADRLTRLDTPAVHAIGERVEAIVDVRDGAVEVLVLAGRLTLGAVSGAQLDARSRIEVTPAVAYAVSSAQWFSRLEAGQGARIPLARHTVDGVTRSVVLPLQPLPHLRPPGFERIRFEDAGDESLAISSEFARRLYLGRDGALKVRFHWLNPERYPLALDELPPHLVALLNDAHTEVEGLRAEREALRERFDAASVQATNLAMLIDDLQRERDGLRATLRNLDRQSLALDELLDLRRRHVATWLRQAGSGPTWEPRLQASDPLGLQRFTALAESEAVRVKLDQLDAIRSRRLLDEVTLSRQQPRLDRLEQAAAEAQQERDALGERIETLNVQIAGMAEVDEHLAAAEREWRTAAETLESTRALLERTAERLSAATAQQAQVAEQVRAAEAADVRVRAAREAIETARRAISLREEMRALRTEELEQTSTRLAEQRTALRDARAAHEEAFAAWENANLSRQTAQAAYRDAQAAYAELAANAEAAAAAVAACAQDLTAAANRLAANQLAQRNAGEEQAAAAEALEAAQARRQAALAEQEAARDARAGLARAVAEAEAAWRRVQEEARGHAEAFEAAQNRWRERQREQESAERAERVARDAVARALAHLDRLRERQQAVSRAEERLAEEEAQLAAAAERRLAATAAHDEARDAYEDARQTIARRAAELSERRASLADQEAAAVRADEGLAQSRRLEAQAHEERDAAEARLATAEAAELRAESQAVAARQAHDAARQRTAASRADVDDAFGAYRRAFDAWREHAASVAEAERQITALRHQLDGEDSLSDEERQAIEAQLQSWRQREQAAQARQGEAEASLRETGSRLVVAQLAYWTAQDRESRTAADVSRAAQGHAEATAAVEEMRLARDAAVRRIRESAAATREARERHAGEQAAVEAARTAMHNAEDALRDARARREDAASDVEAAARTAAQAAARVQQVEAVLAERRRELADARNAWQQAGGPAAIEQAAHEEATRREQLSDAETATMAAREATAQALEQRTDATERHTQAQQRLVQAEAALRERREAYEGNERRHDEAILAEREAHTDHEEAEANVARARAEQSRHAEEEASIQRDVDEAQARHDEASARLRDAEAAASRAEDERAATEATHERARTREREANVAKEDARQSYEALQEAASFAETRVAELQALLSTIDDEQRAARETIAEAQTQLAEAEPVAADLEALRQRQSELQEDIQARTTQRRTLQRNEFQQRRDADELARRVDSLRQAQRRRRGFEQERDELRPRLAEMERTVADLDMQAAALREQLSPLRERMAAADRQLAGRDRVRNELTALDERHATLMRREEDVRRSKQRLNELRVRIVELERVAGAAARDSVGVEMARVAAALDAAERRREPVEVALRAAYAELTDFHEAVFETRLREQRQRLVSSLHAEAGVYRGLSLHVDDVQAVLHAAIDLQLHHRELAVGGTHAARLSNRLDSEWSTRLREVFDGDTRLGTLPFVTRANLHAPGEHPFETGDRQPPASNVATGDDNDNGLGNAIETAPLERDAPTEVDDAAD